MSPPEIWGPPVWRLFHTMAAQINDERLIPTIMGHIKRICAYLPCPDCSKHATDFWSRVKSPTTKQEMIDILYNFHNQVNYIKRKPPHNYDKIDDYGKINLVYAFNDFIRVYNTKGNMNQLTESFQREIIIKNFKLFMVTNIRKFCPILTSITDLS
jgi:hypothetical protein